VSLFVRIDMKKNSCPKIKILLFTVALALMVSGCKTVSVKPDKTPTQELLMDPLHIGIGPDRELGLIDFDAATLFKEGVAHHQAQNCKKALVFYERILEEFPEARYYSAAAFNAGRCFEEVGEVLKAAERYRIITGQLLRSKDWVDAAFREVGCLITLQRKDDVYRLLQQLLERPELTISDRIDALVLYAESLVDRGELLKGEKGFRDVLRQFKQQEREEFLDPAPAARAEFRLAELTEQRFLASPLRLPEEQMKEDLETKAQLLLDTQAGFLRTIRYGDPEWATAAGYRIGALYLLLHKAMEEAPVPQDLADEEIAVYRDVLRQRTAVLLRKALRIFEMTISLAERNRAETEWTQAARDEMTRVEQQVLSLYESLPEEE
jgi:tetratricopeptide (TPR) repeat protein